MFAKHRIYDDILLTGKIFISEQLAFSSTQRVKEWIDYLTYHVDEEMIMGITSK